MSKTIKNHLYFFSIVAFEVFFRLCGGGYIAFYSTVQTSLTAYVIGGQESKNIVAQYHDESWKKLEDLNRGRYGHGSIVVEDQILVIGGWANGGLGQ